MNNAVAELPRLVAEPAYNSDVIELVQAAYILLERIDERLKSVGLSGPKYQALEQLVRAGGSLSLSALADCRKCVRSNITQLVDRLETEGLVERVNDPEDRRAVRAKVTELGAERFAAAALAVHDLQAELASGLSDSERENFVKAVSSLKGL